MYPLLLQSAWLIILLGPERGLFASRRTCHWQIRRDSLVTRYTEVILPVCSQWTIGGVPGLHSAKKSVTTVIPITVRYTSTATSRHARMNRTSKSFVFENDSKFDILFVALDASRRKWR